MSRSAINVVLTMDARRFQDGVVDAMFRLRLMYLRHNTSRFMWRYRIWIGR